MRYLVGLAVALALVALPLSVSAQDAAESATPEASAEEPVTEKPTPSAEPAPEEPALQLKLDEAGVEVTPTPPRTFNGYTLEELELRKRRAALGLIAPAAITAAGVALVVLGTTGDCHDDFHSLYSRDACRRPRIAGGVLTGVGGLGMIVGGWLVAQRANELPQVSKDYTLEEMELRVKRAQTGLYVSTGVLGAGGAIFLVASFVAIAQWGEDTSSDRAETAMLTGGVLLSAGLVGSLTSAILLRRRTHDRDRLKQAQYGTVRRVQWDLARSALVF